MSVDLGSATVPVSQPEEWMDTWNDLFAAGDVDGILEMYTADAVFVGEPKNPAPCRRDAPTGSRPSSP